MRDRGVPGFPGLACSRWRAPPWPLGGAAWRDAAGFPLEKSTIQILVAVRAPRASPARFPPFRAPAGGPSSQRWFHRRARLSATVTCARAADIVHFRCGYSRVYGYRAATIRTYRSSSRLKGGMVSLAICLRPMAHTQLRYPRWLSVAYPPLGSLRKHRAAERGGCPARVSG